MELSELIGQHKLTGVDFAVESVEHYGELQDCNVVNFALDGTTYTVVEDPSDGYRSAMREIKVSAFKITNKFKAVKVVATMRKSQGYSDDYDILDLIDVVTGKIVLSVGTDHRDSYYPSFVSDWQPENLHINQIVEVKS